MSCFRKAWDNLVELDSSLIVRLWYQLDPVTWPTFDLGSYTLPRRVEKKPKRDGFFLLNCCTGVKYMPLDTDIVGFNPAARRLAFFSFLLPISVVCQVPLEEVLQYWLSY